MSIPPLVCSTPPPPDQCEEDKDPEDFDLSYRLSQDEDDEDAYDYGSFSSFSNYQTPNTRLCDSNMPSISTSKLEKESDFENHKENIEYKYNNNGSLADDSEEHKLKCHEDINIEDLNLKVNEDIVIHNDNERQCHKDDEPQSQLPTPHSPSIPSSLEYSINPNSVCCDENAAGKTDSDKESGTDNVDKETDKQFTHLPITEDVNSENVISPEPIISSISFVETNNSTQLEEFSKVLDEPSKLSDPSPEMNMADDEFGDFDDFQFVSSENKISNVVSECDNPWESTDPNNSDFGSFTANFEDIEFQTESAPEIKKVSSYELSAIETQQEDNNLDGNDDDDFGEFDDFKSSALTTEVTEKSLEHSTPCHDVPVLNLHSTDSEQQIMESISKVLTTIFLEEVIEPNGQFEGKLESLLSETWGHLMETDERQPYIVNWNNSLGQKTLLKALCIDSRNILFGPKWNTNMPKYAVNLSVAPLQPQKPLSPSNVSNTETNTEKSSSKPTSWTDPFTSDGQEFTYAEALLLDLEHLMATLDQMAHNHSTLKISELLSHACSTESDSPGTATGSTSLDMFEGGISKKPEKVYSNTLNVQPLRQINLPDTHIFTPTDSETPRSKTIHYDASPTVLLPQSVLSDKKQAECARNENISEIADNSNEDDSDDWEFQDFKSTSEKHNSENDGTEKSYQMPTLENSTDPSMSNNVLPKPSVIFQTQPLQPIKVEPTMPTLNWPEPGKVQGVFDNFSDFVSISSTKTDIDREDSSSKSEPPISQNETSQYIGSLNDAKKKIETECGDDQESNLRSDDFDDDFNTFQSALPPIPSNMNVDLNSPAKSTSQISNKIPDFDFAFAKINSANSNTISFPNVGRPNEALTKNFSHNLNTPEIINKSLLAAGVQVKANILQPTQISLSTTSTQNQQKTGQILQPLSLESYSQINWPSPGIDLQDLSRFNPVETLQSLKSDLSVSGVSKGSSPVHNQKTNSITQSADDDVWGEFVSSNPKPPSQSKKMPVFVDDDEWTDFISSPSVKPQNGLNTISLNVHTSSNIQKNAIQNKLSKKTSQMPLDIPTLNYITPKSSNTKSYNDRHFQNL